MSKLFRVAMPLAGCLVLLSVVSAGAEEATSSRTTVVLGETAGTPDPSCPEAPCQAVGSVTGFQARTDQSRLPFRVPRDGRVKSWSLTLAQPTNRQRSFFNGFFGTPPEARLSILRRIPRTSPPRYNLRRHGSIRVLSPFLGQTVRFGASLRVRGGEIVALTIPTWVPVFSQDLSARNVWRASREPGKCTNTTDVRQGEPHQRLNRRATYGCRYTTARLLYTATVVLDR
ncbi:MAG TPA: hypothetical protein VFC52_03270 [Solirubrobacterales bacterium]|nr:hypothetical protein [Solirubrobacterales bacterium]